MMTASVWRDYQIVAVGGLWRYESRGVRPGLGLGYKALHLQCNSLYCTTMHQAPGMVLHHHAVPNQTMPCHQTKPNKTNPWGSTGSKALQQNYNVASYKSESCQMCQMAKCIVPDDPTKVMYEMNRNSLCRVHYGWSAFSCVKGPPIWLVGWLVPIGGSFISPNAIL